MFSSALVCLIVSRVTHKKTTQPIFAKVGGKTAHGPRKKTLYSGDNPDHVTLVLGLGLPGLGLPLGGSTVVLRMARCGTVRCFFNSKNFATLADLAKACALLSGILVLFSVLFSVTVRCSTTVCVAH